jgi:hypothetical protein
MATKVLQPRSYKRVLLITSVVLLVVSIWIHLLENFLIYRLIRGLISLSFLGIVLAFRKKETNPILAGFLFVYSVSSICTAWFENATISAISLFLNFFAYLFLVKAVWPKASFKNLGIPLTLAFILLVVINAYLFYEFISKLRDLANGNLNYIAMLLGAMALVLIGFLSLLYNHSLNSKASLAFTIAIVLFVFAEIFRAIGYYDFGFGIISVYIARLMLITASGLLAHFMLMPKTEEEKLSRKFF